MKEIRALTGLRGIAALVVFLAHTRETLEGRGIFMQVPTLAERLFLQGGRQVDIFFVLSGFILALIYRDWFATSIDKKTYIKFLQRRFARIYPLHAFMLILVIGFVCAAGILHVKTVNGLGHYEFSSLWAYFLLVQAWGFLGDHPGDWNPPAWSISIEALAYLLFPAFIFLVSRFAKSRPWMLLALLTAAGFALNAYTPWGLAGFPGIVRGLSEFALGCATAYIFVSPASEWLKSSLGSVCALAAIVVCFALVPDTGFAIGLFTAPLLLALCGDNAVSRVFSSRPIYFLGEISFSIYLGHFLYSTIAYRIISTTWMQTGTWPLVVGWIGIVSFVLIASTVTYFAIERPGRDLLRRLKTRPKPQQVGAS